MYAWEKGEDSNTTEKAEICENCFKSDDSIEYLSMVTGEGVQKEDVHIRNVNDEDYDAITHNEDVDGKLLVKHTIELKDCQCLQDIKEANLKLENIKTNLPKVEPCSTFLGEGFSRAVEQLWQQTMKMEMKTNNIAEIVSQEFHDIE